MDEKAKVDEGGASEWISAGTLRATNRAGDTTTLYFSCSQAQVDPITHNSTRGPESSDGFDRDRRPRQVWRLAATGLRWAITVSLLAWLAYLVDWGGLWSIVKSADPLFLALSVALDGVIILLSTWRWSRLRPEPGRLRFPGLLRLYLMGVFLNNFLPTSIGGDAGRGMGLALKEKTSKSTAFASVMMERALGFGTFMVPTLLLLPWMYVRFSLPLPIVVLVGLVTLAFVALGTMIISDSVKLLPNQIASTGIGWKLRQFRAALKSYRGRRRSLADATAISVLAFAASIANLVFAARAFGASMTFFEGLLSVPLIVLGSIVPLSIGGLGIIEGIYTFVFNNLGEGVTTGFVVAVFMRAKSLAYGSLGAFVLPDLLRTLLNKRDDSPDPEPDPPGGASEGGSLPTDGGTI